MDPRTKEHERRDQGFNQGREMEEEEPPRTERCWWSRWLETFSGTRRWRRVSHKRQLTEDLPGPDHLCFPPQLQLFSVVISDLFHVLTLKIQIKGKAGREAGV